MLVTWRICLPFPELYMYLAQNSEKLKEEMGASGLDQLLSYTNQVSQKSNDNMHIWM